MALEQDDLRQQVMFVDALGAVYANNQLRLLTTTDVLYYSKAGVYTPIGAAPGIPLAHATSHQDGGTDEINVTGLSGLLADGQTPLAHKTSHQDGGTDEINVTGLSGLLADAQTPLAHKTSHQDGGSDEIVVTDLAGLLADAQYVKVRKNSAGSVFQRTQLNLIEGSNVTLTVADDAVDGEVDITIAAAAGGGTESAANTILRAERFN